MIRDVQLNKKLSDPAWKEFDAALERTFHGSAQYHKTVQDSGNDPLAAAMQATKVSSQCTLAGPKKMSSTVAKTERPKTAPVNGRRIEVHISLETLLRRLSKEVLSAPALLTSRGPADTMSRSHTAKKSSAGVHGGSNQVQFAASSQSHYHLAKVINSSVRPKTAAGISQPSSSRPRASVLRASAADEGSTEPRKTLQRPQTAPSAMGRRAASATTDGRAAETLKQKLKSSCCVTQLSHPNAGNQKLPCHCSPREIPVIGDDAIDVLVKQLPTTTMLMVLVTERCASSTTEDEVLTQYIAAVGKDIFPCNKMQALDFITARSFAKVRTKGSRTETPGLLSIRHRAEPGMLLFYGGGNLVYARRETRPVRGAHELQMVVKQAKASLFRGIKLPKDFQLSRVDQPSTRKETTHAQQRTNTHSHPQCNFNR
jgi:hypothetical protein